MFYQVETAGYVQDLGQSFEIRTKNGAFTGIISERFKTGLFKVWFNSSATRGSARKFRSFEDALNFIHERRTQRLAVKGAA